MNCTACGKPNRPGSAFCQYCGQKLSVEVTGSTTVERPPAATYEPPLGMAGAGPGVAAPAAALPHSPTDIQMGAGGAQAIDIWGPFAGYGTRGNHAAWLLDDLAGKADELHRTVTERLQQREIPNARMDWQTLSGKGVYVERRPFFLIRRGITTVALYIGRFGRDLFISQVTYAKGPISTFRVIILVLMIIFQLFYMYGYTTALLNTLLESNPLFGQGPDMESILFLLCIVGPLGAINTLLLSLAFLYSLYKWLMEKDLLAILRTPPNEFQMDDIVALERSVEETVRQSLDKVGIDTALMPPKVEQTRASRRRLI